MRNDIRKRSLFRLGRGIALCAWVALTGAASAQTVILSAAANASLTFLKINGKALQPASGAPAVTLAGLTLSVVNYNGVQINAALPPVLLSRAPTTSQ